MASRPSIVTMLILLTLAMTMLVDSSAFFEPQTTQISSTKFPKVLPNQWSNDKMFNLQQCWAAFTRIGACVDEINAHLRTLHSGGVGVSLKAQIGPVCCNAAKVIHEHCWPEFIPHPFYLKLKFICAHHPLPSPSPPAVQGPEYPSPSPASQDPPQSPILPQYPTPMDPQDPPQSPTQTQNPSPSPSTNQDPVPSPPTLQYTYPTPPGPPHKI